MSFLDIAYTIIGVEENKYQDLGYARYMTWLQMKPHIKEGTLKEPSDIFSLPTDIKKPVEKKTTREDVERMMESWNKIDNNKSERIVKKFM
tara:strand:+ start:1113 stop:1385 length:273 start_codon:yes stop_codon:yes gene_type:complete